MLVLSIVNVLGAETRFWLQSTVWRSWVSFANEMSSLEKPALHFFRSLHVKNLSLKKKKKKKKGFYLELFAHPNAVSFTIWQCFDFCALRKSLSWQEAEGRGYDELSLANKTLTQSTKGYHLKKENKDSCKHISYFPYQEKKKKKTRTVPWRQIANYSWISSEW